MKFEGIESIEVVEVNNLGSLEPFEVYFKAIVIKGDIKFEGIGETKGDAIIDALTWEDKFLETLEERHEEHNLFF